MHWTVAPFLLPYLAASVVALAVVALLWRRRAVPGCRPLLVLMLAAGFWAVANGLEIVAPTLAQKLFWARLQYFAKVTIPVAWLVTALAWVGRGHWVTPGRLALLCVVPVITVVLTWTTNAHDWMLYDFSIDASGPVPLVAKRYGPWFWVNIAYSYALIFLATLAVLISLFRFPHLYRGQALSWLFAVAAPLLVNAGYVADIAALHGLDLSPAAFAASGVALYWGFRRFHLFDLIPAARETIIESMIEGVLVLDGHGRIVDLNPAAERILGVSAATALGTVAVEVAPSLAGCAPADLAARGGSAAIEVPHDDGARTYELRVSPLDTASSEQRGWLIMLLDVTENRRLQQELQARSVIDELTGAYNRRGFFELAERQLALARRRKCAAVLLFADIDGLKQVNDVHGHAAGDRLIADAAAALRAAFRETDVIGRFGGDEFTVLAIDADLRDAPTLRTRLDEALQEINRDAPHAVAFSVGFARLEPASPPASLYELLSRADSAMYDDKRTRHAAAARASGTADSLE